MINNKLIVVTRPEPEAILFKKRLVQYGAKVYTLPSFKIESNTSGEEVGNALVNISKYSWIIFTSAKGVDFFLEALKILGISKSMLASKKIAAVGPRTAQRVTTNNLKVHFVPSLYTTSQLAKEIGYIQGQKILLPRAAIASKKLVSDLQKKGAFVTDIPIYKTEFMHETDPVFEDLVKKDKVDYITFTSPSTVKGFLERLKEAAILEKVLKIPVISIGPVTTKTAQKHGFITIFTAESFTTHGMVKKLQEIS